MATKKYVNLSNLSTFLSSLRETFAGLNHAHNLSDLTDDSTHRTVTDAEKETWNSKSDFSGDYNDLNNKPSIPSISGLATENYANTAATAAANKVKDDLLNGAGTAYDTLKELGDLIDDNVDAIDALGTVAAGKADKSEFNTHVADTTAHITSAERSSWNAKDSVSFEQITTGGNTIGTITINDVNTTLYAPMVSVNVGESSTSTNSAATDPYIKIRDTNGFRGQVRIQGDGATTVESNSSGTITISSTDTDTKVKQMETAANGNFPLLLAPTDVASTDYRYSYYADGIYANPSLKKIYADISGNASTASGLSDDAPEKEQLNYGGIPIANTSGDGTAYTATIDGITELKSGTKITIIPHTNSTTKTATLNVNNLGAKQIRMKLTTNTTTTTTAHLDNWLVSGKPVTLMYNGTYWVTDYARPDANTIYGTVKVANGGTGKTTVTAGNFLVGNGTDAMVEKTPAEVAELIGARGITYTATISTAWSGSAAPYSQEIVVNGILANDDPIVDLIISDDYETSQLQLKDWANIYRIETAVDKIIIYTTKPTDVELPIQLLVSRDRVIEVGTRYYSVTLSTNWEGIEAPYSQTIALDGILESDRPKVYFEAPDIFEDLEPQQNAFVALYDIETNDGQVTFKAQGLPEVAFNVTLEVTRI